MHGETVTVIKPKNKLFELNIRELWQYRDLVVMFVKRNLKTLFKQTVLGPAWIALSPIISTLISTFVFGTIAGIASDGVPYFLFYMCGHTVWTFFAQSITGTAETFTANSNVFGKVYFPRLTVPVSKVLTGVLNFLIQTAIFAVFLIYYIVTGQGVHVTWALALVPLLILEVGMLGMGMGIIVSSLTTKYRDLTVVIGFGIQLWMYITPVIYPVSSLPDKWKVLCMLNPMAPVTEVFRYAFLGTGEIPYMYWGISAALSLVILLLGTVLFNRVEKTFMDTV